MKSAYSVLAALVAAPSLAWGHYVFDKLIIDGEITEPWQYVRENTREAKFMPTKFFNSFGTTPLDDDFRCNQGAFSSAKKTATANVAPGVSLGMELAYGATMQHPGPAQVYMSKSTGRVDEYDGSGDWFKIHQETVCGSRDEVLRDEDWCTWDKNHLTFQIPVDTPPGEYLVRVEHIGLHGGHVGEAEFYYSCAQIRVSGNGNGQPGPLVKISGVYNNEEPGIRFNIYGAPGYSHNPGPALWNGNEAPTGIPPPTGSDTSSTTTPTQSGSTCSHKRRAKRAKSPRP